MKETLHMDCPAGKSIIESMALRLIKEMDVRRQRTAMAEFEMEDLKASVRMTIDIIL